MRSMRRRRPRPSDLLLAAALLLLMVATANAIEGFSDSHERRAADRAAFLRETRGQGRFSRPSVFLHVRYDVACAVERGPGGVGAGRICLKVQHRP